MLIDNRHQVLFHIHIFGIIFYPKGISIFMILHFTACLLLHWQISRSISSMLVSSIVVISVVFDKCQDKYFLNERLVNIYELLFFIWLLFLSNNVIEDVPDLSWTNAVWILIHLPKTSVVVTGLLSQSL